MPKLYQKLLQESFSQNILQENSIQLPDELILQSHWFSGHFGIQFTTDEGESVTIQQFGFWNHSAGPDFVHCSLTIDGEEKTGAIELDISAEHWKLHGHQENPSYTEVILHVVFTDEKQKSFTRDKVKKHIPRVTISSSLLEEALGQPRIPQAVAHLGRCSKPLEKASTEHINTLFESAFKHRLIKKSTRIQHTEKAHGKEQALWLQISETLGYRPNSMNFKILAQRLPIQQLMCYSSEEISAILFGTSGFLHPKMHESAPEDSQKWLSDLWQTWWKLRQDHELDETRTIQWNLAGIRPVNHPQRRLAALAQVAIHWQKIKQLNRYELSDYLTTLEDSFWNYHYTLTSKRSAKPLKLIGQDRMNDLLINHLLPDYVVKGDNAAWEQLQQFKAPVISEKVARATARLLGEHPQQKAFLKKSWQHQALLQIYQDFCLEDTSNCEDCPFPEQLKVWSERGSNIY